MGENHMEQDQQTLSLWEIQMVELDIMKAVVHWFDKHGISYCLCGGTMLGAVRHEGFIPWDDDMDLLVPREDYDRIRKLLAAGAWQDRTVVFSCPGDDRYPYPFIKVMNREYIVSDPFRDASWPHYIWIDIFPLDHFPDEDGAHRRVLRTNYLLNRILGAGTLLDDGQKTPAQKARAVVLRMLYRLLGGYRRLTVLIDRYARHMNRRYRDSQHVGDGTWPNGWKDYFTVDSVFPMEKHLFEGEAFNIPVHYDKYLTQFYGNYMELPPPEQRGGHHMEAMKRP